MKQISFTIILFYFSKALMAFPTLEADLVCKKVLNTNYLVINLKHNRGILSLASPTNIGIEVKNSSGNIITPRDFPHIPYFRWRGPGPINKIESIKSEEKDSFLVVKVRQIKWGNIEYSFPTLIPFLRKHGYTYRFTSPQLNHSNLQLKPQLMINDINSSIYGNQGQHLFNDQDLP